MLFLIIYDIFIHMKAQDLIEKYGMQPHAEGGYFCEIWQSSQKYIDSTRNCASIIYYLLSANEISRWHRLQSDELWLHHYGGEVTITLGGNGAAPDAGQKLVIGSHDFHAVIPAGTWQTAQGPAAEFALVSCIVSPAYDVREWELWP